MATLTFPAATTQYIYVPVASTGDLTSATVEMAFLSDVRADPVEADWLPATWILGRARIMVGPATGGAITLTAGTTYNVWVRIGADPEKPVLLSGPVIIF